MSLTVEKCLQAWTNSLRQLNVKADVVFFGDSLTYYGDFSVAFPDEVVCNLGLRGDTIQGMIDRIEQVKIVRPDKVFLMAGINDVPICHVDEFENRFAKLICTLVNELCDTNITVQSMLPVNDRDFCISCSNHIITQCNKAIRSVANNFGLEFWDLYSVYTKTGCLDKEKTDDGIHLKAESYQEWIDYLIKKRKVK